MSSQAIISTMEVLDAQPINELVTEKYIKVCYISDKPNRNGTIINKEIGREIAATLPGAPVVGFFNKETGDFEEHSRRFIVEDGEFKIEEITRPYGFVSPTDNPWYQNFEEEGEVRTYLMCKAYFWTRQYIEANFVDGKGQSMELNEDDINGYYDNDGTFVFTSATLDKLCILGDEFEPCFSGAKIFSNYVKQYTTLAEELETTIGRRYYVLDNKLVEKPEIITLDYALSLGWKLEDLVSELIEVDEEGHRKYYVEDIYTENNLIYVILIKREDSAQFRVLLEIKGENAIELGEDFIPVKKVWQPITLTEGEPSGVEVNPEDNTLDGVGSDFGLEEKNDTTEETIETAPESALEETLETIPEVEPVVDFSNEDLEKANASIKELNDELESYKAKIESYEAELEEFKNAEKAREKIQKEELIESYRAMLDEDEIKPISEKIDEYSIDDIEAKLAVTYTRKKKSEVAEIKGQVNINSVNSSSEDNLPDYIKRAKEIDKSLQLSFNI